MGIKLSDLNFSAKFAALSNSTHDLQEPITSICEIAAGLSLSNSSKKTKNMLISEPLMLSNISIGQRKIEKSWKTLHTLEV